MSERSPLLDSMKSLFRQVTESSVKVLSKDVLQGSREQRRAKKLRQAGIKSGAAQMQNAGSQQRESLSGQLTRGKAAPYSVDGRDFTIDEATWIVGELRVGAPCSVILAVTEAGALNAVKIVVKEV